MVSGVRVTNLVMGSGRFGFHFMVDLAHEWLYISLAAGVMEGFSQCFGSVLSFQPVLCTWASEAVSLFSFPFSNSHLLFLVPGVCWLSHGGQDVFSVFSLFSGSVRQSLCS